MDKVKFGQKIRALREATGLSRLNFALASGVAKISLEEIELGTGNPTLATLEAIAGQLGLAISDLFPDSDKPVSNKAGFNEFHHASALLSFFEKAEPQIQAFVLAYLSDDLSYIQDYPESASALEAISGLR